MIFMRNCMALVLSAIFLCGCAEAECNQYRSAIEDEKLRQDILEWADGAFFEIAIKPDEIVSGGLIGPGDWRVRSREILARLPVGISSGSWFSEGRALEVRLLGENPLSPHAVFLGRKSYKGLVISKGEIISTLKELEFRIDRDVQAPSGRLAILCYQE